MNKFPDGWSKVKLGDVVEFVRGVSFASTDLVIGLTIDSLPILRAGNIQNQLSLMEDLVYVRKEKVLSSQLLLPGDIVICMSSGSSSVVGKTSYFDNKDWKGSVGVFCGIIRATDVDPKFLSYWFKSTNYYIWRNSQSRGSNIQNLRFSEIGKIDLHVPPVNQQNRIAEILDEKLAAVEEARKAAEQRLEQVRALRAAYLREMFPAAGEKLPEGWKWMKLGEVCKQDKKIIDPKSKAVKELPYIGLEHVESNTGLIYQKNTQKDVGISTAYYFDNSHVLYGKLRPYLNKVALPTFSGRCSTELIPLKPTLVTRNYLAHFLRRSEIVDAVMVEKTGTRMPRASIEVLLRQVIPVPPLSKQIRIIEELDTALINIFEIEKQIEDQLALISKLTQAYLRQAFRGELA